MWQPDAQVLAQKEPELLPEPLLAWLLLSSPLAWLLLSSPLAWLLLSSPLASLLV